MSFNITSNSCIGFNFFPSQTEEQVKLVQDKLSSIEEELDDTERRHETVTQKLVEIEVRGDEVERQYGELSARSETDQVKIDTLEEQLSEVKSKDEELSGNYETVRYLFCSCTIYSP